MKRDLELIRKILINVEEDKYPYGGTVLVDGYSAEVCAYHVALMRDAGLVDADVVKTMSSPTAFARIDRLTNTGHDFCDGIRRDTIWNKVQEHVIKPGAAWTLSLVIEYVKIEVRRRVLGRIEPLD